MSNLLNIFTSTSIAMRFKLTLQTDQKPALVGFNYQYPLSSAIYKVIERSDAAFADFLHNAGYGAGNKSFKLFTFSDLNTPFTIQGDRMKLITGQAEFIICFFLPQAAEHFVTGLFMNQRLELADRVSKTVFYVSAVESLPLHLPEEQPVLLQPLSPLVVGRKNERGHYDYRSPEDPDFADCLVYNWIEKYIASGLPVTTEEPSEDIVVDVLLSNQPPKKRLITIKEGTPAATSIRGYTRFKLSVKAPPEMLALALGAGLGLHNAMGMGCVVADTNHYRKPMLNRALVYQQLNQVS